MSTQIFHTKWQSGRAWLLRHETAIWLALYALIVLIRVPSILSHGRFWAEEGKIFYHNAASMPPLKALFNSFGGYLNLPTNAATLIAWYISPIEYAPYITTFFGFLGEMLPAIVVLTARDTWLRHPLARGAALASIVFVPANSEVWLQSLHLQLQFALCCALILALQPNASLFRRLILFMAPLGGPGAVVFVPLFFFRALIERSKTRFQDAVILLIPAIIQVTFFCVHQDGRGQDYWFGPGLAAVFCREPLQLISGGNSGLFHDVILYLFHFETLYPNRISWADFALVAAFLPFLLAGLFEKECRSCLWMILANTAFTGAGVFGAIGGSTTLINQYGGERYFYVGQVLFLLMVLAFAANSKRNIYRIFGGALMVWMLFFAQQQYWHRSAVQSSSSSSIWSTEVKTWRHNHNYSMRIWPDPWTLDLH